MPTYKDEKRGTYYCSFYYTDWTGKRKKKKKEGFKTQREAKAFEIDFLSKQQNNCDMTFEQMVDLYLEDSKSRVRNTTFANKKELIDLKITPYFKSLKLTDITPNHIRQWQNELKSQEYSDTYLKTINNQLTAIFNFAIKYYNLPSSPAFKAGSMGKKNAESMQFWTIDEFKKFITHCKKTDAALAFKILFWTGIRRGELMALTFEDINFESHTININKTFTKLNGKEVINPPKTAKSKRIISISSSLETDIKNYFTKLYDYKLSDRIFNFGLPYLSYYLKTTSKKSGVKPIRVHDLRHSHASLLIN